MWEPNESQVGVHTFVITVRNASYCENENFDSVHDYAKEAVSAFIRTVLVNGKNGKIAPNDYTTRAEVVVLIKRVLDYLK